MQTAALKSKKLLFISTFALASVLIGASLVVHALQHSARALATADVNVDFTSTVHPVAPFAFSSTISTYGSNGSIASSSKQRANLGSLGLGLYRIPLQWNGGNIISSAGGGPTNISGDTWLSNIRAFGGTPMIVLGGSKDNNFTPSDAANMVKHFNSSASTRVGYWVIGNEPGNSGMSIQTYCNLFNSSVDAMKAVDPSIKVAGPAWAYFDSSTLNTFLQCAGSKVDIIDYHHYGMGTTYLDNTTALNQTVNWESEVNQTKQMITQIVPNRAKQIDVQVGEYNWSWRTQDGYPGWNGDDRFYQSVATVWGASVAGHIMAAGGRGNQYSDQNGALGITFEQNDAATHYGQQINDPMPIYHGLRMFSGGNLFRGFGNSMVAASTSLPNIEVFASTNQKNVVLINKDQTITRNPLVQLTGVTNGTVDAWQTNQSSPFAAPTKISTLPISNGAVTTSLPPYSVTTLVINDGASGPAPAPAPSPTPVSPSSAGSIMGIAGKCLDNKYAQLRLDNTIWLYGCNGTAAQQWSARPDGTIRLTDDFCLGVEHSSIAPETPVRLKRCDGDQSLQWQINANGSIVNKKSKLCLDDKHSGTADGNLIWIYGCNGSAAQKWSVSSVISGQPSTPTNLQVTALSYGIALTWSAGNTGGLAKFEVVRNGQTVASFGANITAYTDTSVTAGQTYSYQVVAIGKDGSRSDRSAKATIAFGQPTSPAPTGRDKFEPASGKTYLGVNVDFNKLDSFNNAAGIKGQPALYGRYTTPDGPFQPILDQTATKPGLTPIVHWNIPMDNAQITNGSKDAYIKSQADAVKKYGKPVFIRPDWEMNGSWYPHWSLGNVTPMQYVASWNHIHSFFKDVPNAAFVWCPNNLDYFDKTGARTRTSAWYPNDNTVDWVCVDAYPEAAAPNDVVNGIDGMNQMAEFAAAHKKPIMLGEWAVNTPHPDTADPVNLVFDWAERYPNTVKALVYFDFITQGKDFTLEGHPVGAAAFRARTVNNPRYINNLEQ